jgi:hypothetical protein
MSRTRNKIIRSLIPALVVAAAVASGASASERTATELGQSIGSPPTATPNGRTATELGQSTGGLASAKPSGESSDRTATELGQAVGEPGDRVQTFARTATELGQTVGEPGDAVHAGDYQDLRSPAAESGGFDWGDAAIVAGGGLGLLIGAGGIVLFTRRRGGLRRSRTPVVSS